MNVLFIGGTGNISSAVSRLAIRKGIDLSLVTRGKSPSTISGAKEIVADIHGEHLPDALTETHWDCVVNWIAFNEQDIQRDIDVFSGKTAQYIFISSASVYQKPLRDPIITESTPLCNPYWAYAQQKIACEERLQKAYRDTGFPITIVRPSLTYDTVIPLAIGGFREYTVIDRMKKGKKIIVHGDGTSLWTVTHSEDFAKGFVGLLGNFQAIGHAFHITADEILTWNQMYELVGEAVGVTPNLVHIPSEFIGKFLPGSYGSLLGDKAVSAIFDNAKIKRFVPEFQATIRFRDGIKRTIDWFEAYPERQLIDQDTDVLLDKIIERYESALNGALP